VLPKNLKKVAVNVAMFICPSFRLSGNMEERDSHCINFFLVKFLIQYFYYNLLTLFCIKSGKKIGALYMQIYALLYLACVGF